MNLAIGLASYQASAMSRGKPECFGFLYNRECRNCALAEYCAYVVKHRHFPYAVARERDLEPVMRTGFKDGSRAALLIRRWALRQLTLDQLEQLSQKLFGSVIDIPRIIIQLRKRRVLTAEKGGRFGIRPAQY